MSQNWYFREKKRPKISVVVSEEEPTNATMIKEEDEMKNLSL